MKLLLKIALTAAALTAAVGCSAPQSEPQMAKIVERRTNDNALQIAELKRVVEGLQTHSAVLQHQLSSMQQDQFQLQKKLCEKDRTFCTVLEEQ